MVLIMKSILDPTFKYTPAVATNIMDRFKANGLIPRKQPMTELERLRQFRREIEAHANFANHKVIIAADLFEELLAECDGVSHDH